MTIHSADAERLAELAIALENTAYELHRRVTQTTAACVAAGVAPPSTRHVLEVVEWLREQATDVRKRIIDAVRADRVSKIGFVRHIARVHNAWMDGVWDGVAGIAKGATALVQTAVANTIDVHAIGAALVDGDADEAWKRTASIARRDWNLNRAIVHNVTEMDPLLGPVQFVREAHRYGVWTALEDSAHKAGTQAPTVALIVASSGLGVAAEAGTLARVSSVVKTASDLSNVSVFAPIEQPAPRTSAGDERPLPSEADAEAAGRRHPAQALP
jgi:hypothetical protein